MMDGKVEKRLKSVFQNVAIGKGERSLVQMGEFGEVSDLGGEVIERIDFQEEVRQLGKVRYHRGKVVQEHDAQMRFGKVCMGFESWGSNKSVTSPLLSE